MYIYLKNRTKHMIKSSYFLPFPMTFVLPGLNNC